MATVNPNSIVSLGPDTALPDAMKSGFRKSRSRADLKRNTLIGLGAPTIKIEITNAQLENAVNNALRLFLQHHRNGSFENYYAVSISAEQARLGYCRVPENIDAVIEVVHVGQLSTAGTGNGASNGNTADGSDPATNLTNQAGSMQFASIVWQMNAQAYAGTNMAIGNAHGKGGGSVNGMGVLGAGSGGMGSMSWGDWMQAKSYMTNLISMNSTPHRFAFVRYQRKINLFFNVKEGDVICFRVYENIDPDKDEDLAGEVFDDYTLQSLTTAHVKVVWGSVLRKFGGITLPGGVMLNGDDLIAEGNAEIAAILEELSNSQPVEFFVG